MNTHKTNWSLILLLWIAGMGAAGTGTCAGAGKMRTSWSNSGATIWSAKVILLAIVSSAVGLSLAVALLLGTGGGKVLRLPASVTRMRLPPLRAAPCVALLLVWVALGCKVW